LFIGTALGGLYAYYSVCSKHAESIKALNEPPVVELRKTLEARIKALEEWTESLESDALGGDLPAVTAHSSRGRPERRA